MAKVVEKFLFQSGGRGRKQMYPWEEWLDGRIWELKRGNDFNGKAKAMVEQARLRCFREGLRLRGQVLDENTIRIQAIRDEGGGK